MVDRILRDLGGDHAFSRLDGYVVSQGLLALGGCLESLGHSGEYVALDLQPLVSPEEDAVSIAREGYDGVLISVFSALQHNRALATIRALRQLTDSPILVGGQQAGAIPGPFLDAGADAVFKGAVEEFEVALAETVASRPKSARRVLASGRCPPSLNLGWIDYALLPRDVRERACVSITLRYGCRFSCAFCPEGHFWGRQSKLGPFEEVGQLMQRYLEAFGHNHVFISDTGFQLPADLDLFEWLHERFPTVYWHVNLRVDQIADQCTCERLRAAGVVGVYVGVESFSDKVLRTNYKGFAASFAQEALVRAGPHFPFFTVGLIVGLPGETPDTVRMTVEAVGRLFDSHTVSHVTFRNFVPYPGTPAFRSPEAFGLKITTANFDYFHRLGLPVVSSEGFGVLRRWTAFLDAVATSVEGMTAQAGLCDGLDRFRGAILQDVQPGRLHAWEYEEERT